MKLLLDMNLSPRWVEWLLEAGQEAVHWSTMGNVTASDADIMNYARAHRYIVLTHDLDFGAMLAASNEAMPSVVQIRAEDNSPDFIGIIVLKALYQMRRELVDGALLTIEPSRARIRLLPIGNENDLN